MHLGWPHIAWLSFIELDKLWSLSETRSGAVAERSNPTSKEWWLRGCRRAERSYSTFKVRWATSSKVRRSDCALLEHS